MLDKMFNMKWAEEEKQSNPVASDRPIIGICFDWRLDAHSGKYAYIPGVMQDYRNAIEQAGGELFVLSFDDNIEDYKDRLDGYLIPGGRDIHPKFYNAEINGAVVSDIADIHFNFNRNVYNKLSPACPLLGICWGFQFLNVINGGTMTQHMHDTDHHYCKRRFEAVPGSWLHRIAQGPIKGNCYHHQTLDKLGSNVHITAIDDYSKVAHALEVRAPGRDITGILWHPEISFKNESRDAREEGSMDVLRGFVDKCAHYKRRKPRAEGHN